MRRTESQNNPTARLKVATCEFCGCRTALGFHWYVMSPRYLSGHACDSCSIALDAMTDEQIVAWSISHQVAEQLNPQP